MSDKLIKLLDSLSESMEIAVRVYCELNGNASYAITMVVLEKFYLAGCSEIVHEEVRKSILEYYANKENSNEELLAA